MVWMRNWWDRPNKDKKSGVQQEVKITLEEYERRYQEALQRKREDIYGRKQ